MSKVVRFIKTALIYFLGNILSKIISFVLLPLYTSKIDPSQYGNYDLITTLLNVIYPVAFFQIWDSMFRYVFDYAEEGEQYHVINNSIYICGFGSFFYLLIMLCASSLYHIDYFWLVCVLGLCEAVRYLYSFVARAFLMNKLFAFSGAINTFVNASLNVVLIAKYGWDIKALYFAPIIGCLVQIATIEGKVHLIRHFNTKDFSKALIRDMLKFSVPLCIATVSYWLLSGLTKVVVTKYLGSYSNGLYAVANRFAAMITLFVSVFQFAWNESAYLLNAYENRSDIFQKCISIFSKMIICGTGSVICLINVIFPFFVATGYSAAKSIIPTCLVGVCFNSVAGFLATLFMTEKKTNHVLSSTLVAALINIVLCIPLTNLFDLQGAILALDIAFLILLMIRIVHLNKVLMINFDYSILWCVTILAICIWIFYNGNVYLNILGCLCSAFFALYSIKYFLLPIVQKLKAFFN